MKIKKYTRSICIDDVLNSKQSGNVSEIFFDLFAFSFEGYVDNDSLDYFKPMAVDYLKQKITVTKKELKTHDNDLNLDVLRSVEQSARDWLECKAYEFLGYHITGLSCEIGCSVVSYDSIKKSNVDFYEADFITFEWNRVDLIKVIKLFYGVDKLIKVKDELSDIECFIDDLLQGQSIVFDWDYFYRSNDWPDTDNWLLLFSEYNETEYFIINDRKKWTKKLKVLIKNKVNLSYR